MTLRIIFMKWDFTIDYGVDHDIHVIELKKHRYIVINQVLSRPSLIIHLLLSYVPHFVKINLLHTREFFMLL